MNSETFCRNDLPALPQKQTADQSLAVDLERDLSLHNLVEKFRLGFREEPRPALTGSLRE